jgi:hypothetical protein
MACVSQNPVSKCRNADRLRRVSTDDQNLTLQRDALEVAGCEWIFEDYGISGATRDRPGLDSALATLLAGDVLVWKLDRLGRSLPHLVETLALLGERDVGFRSPSEALESAESEVLNRTVVTIPAKDWEAFEAWLHRPAETIAPLVELAHRTPSWER